MMKRCLYCDTDKPLADFSDEHIWPDALGGDFLPQDIWRTDAVCRACNNTSGVFVDGAFIRSWFGKASLSYGSHEYLAGAGKPVAIPLDFLGPIADPPPPAGYIADYWAGPCGANIIHIRPADKEEIWGTYAGGDPRAKKSKAGRAYMALTTADGFWVEVALASFEKHFDRAARYLVNAEVTGSTSWQTVDRSDPAQAGDLKTIDAVLEIGRNGAFMRVQPKIDLGLGARMLAKLGLAVGYQLAGDEFLATPYSKTLRAGFREADFAKRRSIPVRGSGFLNGFGLGRAEEALAWPGGWVLMVMPCREQLALSVIGPSGNAMVVMISDEPSVIARVARLYAHGVVWITVPVARVAVGPVPLPEYLAHKTGDIPHPDLSALDAKRGDANKLPKCR